MSLSKCGFLICSFKRLCSAGADVTFCRVNKSEPADLGCFRCALRFHEILKTLTDSDDGKLHILKVVYEVWRNHPQVRPAHTGSCFLKVRGCLACRCAADDRRVGGQNDSDADRGLCRRRQLALLSGHGPRVHQVS